MKKKLIAIVNPKSGTHDQAGVPALIDKVIDKHRFHVALRRVEGPGDAERFAREAAADGCYGVLAVGGDGTVNGAAAGLVHSATALAVIPCGSGNGLARHMRIPMDVERALQVVNRDEVQAVDCGMVNGTPFLCTCGMGFDAQVAYKFAIAGERGFITYFKKIFSEYFTYRPETYDVALDGGEPMSVRAFVLTCCNAAQYGNNAYIAPHASLQDGLLDLTLITPVSLATAPLTGVRLLTKRLDHDRHVHIYRARTIYIHRHTPGPMHIDGDPVTMPQDLHIECQAGAVRMFVPGLGEDNAS